MVRMPLRWKIFLYSSALLMLLIASMLIYVNAQSHTFVNQAIADHLEQGRRLVQSMENERLAGLRLTAQ